MSSRDTARKLQRRLHTVGICTRQHHQTMADLQIINCFRFGHRQVIRNLHHCRKRHKSALPDLVDTPSLKQRHCVFVLHRAGSQAQLIETHLHATQWITRPLQHPTQPPIQSQPTGPVLESKRLQQVDMFLPCPLMSFPFSYSSKTRPWMAGGFARASWSFCEIPTGLSQILAHFSKPKF